MKFHLAVLSVFLTVLAAIAIAARVVYPADVPDWLWLTLLATLVVSLIASVFRLERALAAGRRTEEAYRLLFEDASDAIVVASRALDILEVNSRACELLGYSREEMLGKNLRDLVAPEESAVRPLRLPDLIGEGKTLVQERNLVRKDGVALVLEVSARLLRDGRLVAIGRDVTGRRAAEEALKASEALTRSVVYTAVDGIITADERGIVESFNPAAERLFGYAAEEVIGKSLSLLMPPVAAEEHQSQIQRYLETGVRNIIGIGRETMGRRKDGTVFPIELSVSEMLLPGRRLFTGIVHDITARKRNEAALRTTNAKLQAVIETSPLAVMTLDLAGNVLGWNPAAERIFGWTAAETIGRPIPTVPESERAEFIRSLEQNARGEAQVGIERRRRRKDGSPVDVSVWTGLLRGPDGAVSAVLAIAADVTQRNLIEEQFRHAQKMDAVSRLAGGVAHDFNNLLTVITGYGQMSFERSAGDPQLRAHIEEILKAADQASALANQLLVFGKHRVAAHELLDLRPLVERIEPMLRRMIGENITLEIAARPDLGMVRAEASQIEQVIINLAANARDAMPSGGRLTIELSNVELGPWYAQSHRDIAEGDYVMLAVSDTGTGIAPETRAHLFEPFFTTKERGKRAGLGLSTVYGIVRQSGGHIWVYSELGQGTSFKVYLPRVERATPRHVPAPAKPAPRAAAETVLLVEDETGVRALVREILRQNGYKVLEAADVDDALRLCREHEGRIHLLLTDVVMPIMSGRELAERASALRPDLRVLYMSGYTDNVVIHHGVNSSIADFLQKPFTPSVLARKVREVLDRGE
ncbi:MAG TPA: PAS domain S-box protein [Bryobacteraceae bacterium]|nr:PAS domain S-box protein [Bryobacteraceae bacterium]